MVGTWFILLPFFDRGLAAFFFLLFQEMRYGMARVFVTRCFNFSTAFTVDWLTCIHLWKQDLSEVLVLDEIWNSQLFSSAYIFNSQTWISTRILRVCKREFRALHVLFRHVRSHRICWNFFPTNCVLRFLCHFSSDLSHILPVWRKSVVYQLYTFLCITVKGQGHIWLVSSPWQGDNLL